jgi:hypothetical protein
MDFAARLSRAQSIEAESVCETDTSFVVAM